MIRTAKLLYSNLRYYQYLYCQLGISILVHIIPSISSCHLMFI